MGKEFKTKAEEFRYYVMERLSDGERYGVKELEDYVYKKSSLKREDLPNGSMPTVFRDFRNTSKYGIKRVSRGVYQKVEGGITLTENMELKLKSMVEELERDVKTYMRNTSVEDIKMEDIKKAQEILEDLNGVVKSVGETGK